MIIGVAILLSHNLKWNRDEVYGLYGILGVEKPLYCEDVVDKYFDMGDYPTEEIHIHGVSIAEDKRGKGLGSYFLARLINMGKDASLYVLSDNERAIKCYENLGFTIKSRHPAYIPPNKDGLVTDYLMTADIILKNKNNNYIRKVFRYKYGGLVISTLELLGFKYIKYSDFKNAGGLDRVEFDCLLDKYSLIEYI